MALEVGPMQQSVCIEGVVCARAFVHVEDKADLRLRAVMTSPLWWTCSLIMQSLRERCSTVSCPSGGIIIRALASRLVLWTCRFGFSLSMEMRSIETPSESAGAIHIYFGIGVPQVSAKI